MWSRREKRERNSDSHRTTMISERAVLTRNYSCSIFSLHFNFTMEQATSGDRKLKSPAFGERLSRLNKLFGLVSESHA